MKAVLNIVCKSSSAAAAPNMHNLCCSTCSCATDDASLGSPVVASPEAAAETGSAQQALNTAELQEYLAGQGEWMLPAEAAASSATGATAAVPQHAALGRVVAELAALAQKLEGRQLPLPAAGGSADGVDAVLTAADAAAEQLPEKTDTSTIKAMPLKLAVVSLGCDAHSMGCSARWRFACKLSCPAIVAPEDDRSWTRSALAACTAFEWGMHDCTHQCDG